MPELPEVAYYKKYILEHCRNKIIADVSVLDAKVVKGPAAGLIKLAKQKKIKQIHRTGKYLFWELDKGALMMHFGMSGKPMVRKSGSPPPKAARVIFHFKDFDLDFRDNRKFGRIDPAPDLKSLLERYPLGVDALEVSEKDFIAGIKGRKTPVKATLLDQSSFAGIGNWVADEILFQAKIHPALGADQLTAARLKKLYVEMKRILETSVEHDADWDAFPKWMLVKERGAGGICPRHGIELEKSVVAGRGTFTCPLCQPPAES